jgi:type II secretory pathway pseudopilin PulG
VTTTSTTTSTTTTTATAVLAKCADFLDATSCSQAQGKGKSLGCKFNLLTKKCVPAMWADVVEEGKCAEVVDLYSCQVNASKNYARTAKADPTDPSKLIITGMCRINDDGTVCEQAPVATANDIQFLKDYMCGAINVEKDLSFAALSICSDLESSRCSDIRFDPPGDTQTGLSSICVNPTNGSNKCTVYGRTDSPTGTTWKDSINRFCDRALVKELYAARDFSELVEMVDLNKDCESVRLRTLGGDEKNKTYINGKFQVCAVQKRPH